MAANNVKPVVADYLDMTLNSAVSFKETEHIGYSKRSSFLDSTRSDFKKKNAEVTEIFLF